MKLSLLALACACPALAAGQALLQPAWQLDFRPSSDGTRAQVHSQRSLPIGSEFLREPGFHAQHVVASDDGAYLVLPVNQFGGNANLGTLIPAYVRINRGYQLLKVDAAGAVQWTRHVADATTTAPLLLPLPEQALGSTPNTLLQAQRTADGGIALLTAAGLTVLRADGSLRQRLQADTLCLPDGSTSGQGRLQLTDEDVLLYSNGPLDFGPDHGCAYDLDGTLLDRIAPTPATASMEVGAYRHAHGFLFKEGSWQNGQWQQAALALASSTQVHWRKDGMALAGPERLSIAPGGDSVLNVGEQLLRIARDGTLQWQQPALPQQPLLWLDDGELLLADLTTRSFRRLDAAGNTVWLSADLAPDVFSAQPFQWQVQDGELRVAVVNGDGGDAQLLRLALGSGTVLQNTVLATQDELHADGLGWSGSGELLALGATEPAPGSGWSIPHPGVCTEPGFCPYQADHRQPLVTRLAGASGQAVATLAPADYSYPTSALPLEQAAAALPLPAGDGVIAAYYAHDGLHNRLRVQRIDRTGIPAWSADLQPQRYDLAQATLRLHDGALYLAATELGPFTATGSAWRLDLAELATGQVHWQVALPYPLQQLQPALGAPAELCGLSRGLPTPRQLCLDRASGAIVRDLALTGLPAGRYPLALPQDASGPAASIKVRLLPDGASNGSEYQVGRVLPSGQYLSWFTLSFAAAAGPGERLATDTLDLLQGLAVAAVYPANNPTTRPLALVALAFDNQGQTLWQTRIEQPQRGFAPEGGNTVISRAADGTVYLSSHPPQPGSPNALPGEVCRLDGASGSLLGCHRSPVEGRVRGLLASPDAPGLWAWQSHLLDGVRNGLQLRRIDATGFGPARLDLDSHTAFRADLASTGSDGRLGYFLLSHNGMLPDRGPADLRLLAVPLGEVLFGDGFEGD